MGRRHSLNGIASPSLEERNRRNVLLLFAEKNQAPTAPDTSIVQHPPTSSHPAFVHHNFQRINQSLIFALHPYPPPPLLGASLLLVVSMDAYPLHTFILSIPKLFAYLCSPHSPFPYILATPAFAGSRIVYGPHFRSCSLRAFILYFLFFPLGLGYITVALRAKPHKPHKHIHTYRYQYRGCSSNHRLYGKCRKAFWVSPQTPRPCQLSLGPWLVLAWNGRY